MMNDYIVTMRGRSQGRANILRAKLTTSEALAIETALNAAVDSGWLVQGDIDAVTLMSCKKAMVVLNLLAAHCEVSALSTLGVSR